MKEKINQFNLIKKRNPHEDTYQSEAIKYKLGGKYLQLISQIWDSGKLIRNRPNSIKYWANTAYGKFINLSHKKKPSKNH